MRWFRRPAPVVPFPSPTPPAIEPKRERAPPKDEGIVVEEIDTSALTSTGVHKAWNRLSGRQG